MRQRTHVHVLLDPGVRCVPVLGPDVAVHVPAGEGFLGHSTVLKVSQGREVRLDAHQRLMRSLVAARGARGGGRWGRGDYFTPRGEGLLMRRVRVQSTPHQIMSRLIEKPFQIRPLPGHYC